MNESKQTDFERFLAFGNDKRVPQVLCAVFCELQATELGTSSRVVTCIDLPLHTLKSLNDLSSHDDLSGRKWDVVCITILEGKNRDMATAIETNKRLDTMLDMVRAGNVKDFLMFDRQSNQVEYTTDD